MRSIAFLVIVIITVALAVSCNIKNNADSKDSKVKVSEQQQTTGSNEPKEMFTKAVKMDNEDVMHRIDSLEETISNRLDGINLTVDNTVVIQKLDDLNGVLVKSQGAVQDAVRKMEDNAEKRFNETLGAVFAAIVALMLTQVLVYRYLKKFIAERVLIASHTNGQTTPVAVKTESASGENPVVTAVNNAAAALSAKVSESKQLFDPEKSVKLDSAGKTLLSSINTESAFLKKAGCELPLEYSYLSALEKVNDKNYSEALQILEDVKKADKNYSPAFFLAGYIAYVSRKYDSACENLEAACKLEPENAAYLISYGNACLKEKKYKDASTVLKKAVEIRSNDASAWNNLAHAYILNDKTEDAIGAFTKAAELKPDFHEALHNLGLALGKMKKYEEALAAFEKAIAVKDDKHESMYNAACVYALLGKRDGALKNLRGAIALSADYAAKAKKDKDFVSFKDDDEFKKIVG